MSAYTCRERRGWLRRSPFFRSQRDSCLVRLFFFFRHLAPLSLGGTSRRSEESGRDEDAGGGKAEKFITARAAAVADLILRSAARTSHPWCSLMYALSGTYGDDPVDGWRYGRQMYYVRLNSTPPSIGSPKREQNLLPPAK